MYKVKSLRTFIGTSAERTAAGINSFLAGDKYIETDGGVYQHDGSDWLSISGGVPGGSDTQVQFNDGGAFGGDAGLVFNKTDDALTIGGGLVVNDGANDADIRFESQTISDIFFMDASRNQLLLGSSSPITSYSLIELNTYAQTNNRAIPVIHRGTADTLNSTGFEFHMENSNNVHDIYAYMTVTSSVVTAGSEDGNLALSVMRNGLPAAFHEMDATDGNVFNPNQVDIDFTVKGTAASSLFVVDAGLGAVQIGSGSAGTVADFRSTGIVINENGADIDFRIEGDTEQNLFFVDAGNDRVGIATNSPSKRFHVVGEDGAVGALSGLDTRDVFLIENNNNNFIAMYCAANSNNAIRFYEDGQSAIRGYIDLDHNTDVMTFNTNAINALQIDSSGNVQLLRAATELTFEGTDEGVRENSNSLELFSRATVRIYVDTNDSATGDAFVIYNNVAKGSTGSTGREMDVSGGVRIGNPGGGFNGLGTINTAGDIYKNNTPYTNPDYVLEEWVTGDIVHFAKSPGASDYKRLSLTEIEEFIYKNLHLPRISREMSGIFERGDIVLEKLEEIFIHLIEMNKRLKAVEAIQA